MNQGQLEVGAGGWLQLTGTNLNLSRGALTVTPIEASATGSENFTNGTFSPDVGIYDLYWGQTNMDFDTTGLWDGIVAISPPHGVSGGPTQIGFVANAAASYTNATGGFTFITTTNMDGSTTNNRVFVISNEVRQAIFVGVPNANLFSVNMGFSQSTILTNLFRRLNMAISVPLTNLTSGQPEVSTLYLQDTLSAETNTGVLINLNDGTGRPANYLLQRNIRDLGASGAGFPGPDFLYDPLTMSNTVALASPYAGYGAAVDSLISRAPGIPSGTITNYPGRIRVYADSLDMSSSRIRGEGEVIINSRHLVGSAHAVVDCENLSYNLGSTNGNLRLTSLANTNVNRLTGDILMWSGMWSNTASVITEFTNNYTQVTISTNDPVTGDPTNVTMFVQTNLDFTNVFSLGLHCLMVDATALNTTLPVTVFDLVTHSTNVVLDDNMTVVQSLLIDGKSLTINGNLNLSYKQLPNFFGDPVTVAVYDWLYTNAPNLLYFTNNGAFSVLSEAHFGDDFPTNVVGGPSSYLSFVNRGSVVAWGEFIKSVYCELGGQTTVSGSLDVNAQDCAVLAGVVTAGNDISMHVNNLKLNQAAIATTTRLYLTVTNKLYDSGSGASNSITCGDGFVVKTFAPAAANGDLLGTAVESDAADFGPEVDHTWPAQDRGSDNSGYANNLALGRLSLVPGGAEDLFPPLFVFDGSSVSNALYVDYLDLSQLADYTNEIEINPNLIIYYAAAKLSSGFPIPPNSKGIAQSAEEYLNGQFGGHLRWVSSFAGPNSSVDVVINGQTVKVNRALRFSKIIDSNGNGIPNYYDSDPFGLVLTGALTPANPPVQAGFTISWLAAPATAYTVQYSTNWTTWQTLTTYTNGATTSKNVSVVDTNAPVSGAQRFYRVVY
ncbi:MAG TPA: hypothetical protein VL527_07545 [Dongiaceae bacterium]|nr:hypothetical protein [Dongiaceae bacterium]